MYLHCCTEIAELRLNFGHRLVYFHSEQRYTAPGNTAGCLQSAEPCSYSPRALHVSVWAILTYKNVWFLITKCILYYLSSSPEWSPRVVQYLSLTVSGTVCIYKRPVRLMISWGRRREQLVSKSIVGQLRFVAYSLSQNLNMQERSQHIRR